MKEAKLSRKLRIIAIRTGINFYSILLLMNPVLAWFLWDVRLFRPIILWFSVLIFLFAFKIVFFSIAAFYGALYAAGKVPSKGLFMRLQLTAVYILARFLNGFELHGLENLPKEGGLVVFYHGPFLPVDMSYVFSYVYLKMRRMIGGSLDINCHQNAFFRAGVELYDYSSSREKLIEDLKKGFLRSAAPGGAYESMFSENYELEWRARIGFARAAKEAGVPIIPMFTTNVQHFMPLANFGQQELFKEWYSLTKRPFFIPKGLFPVKMRSYLGEPLHCGEDEAAEEFAKRVKKAIENLRDKHQRKDETILSALWQRVC